MWIPVEPSARVCYICSVCSPSPPACLSLPDLITIMSPTCLLVPSPSLRYLNPLPCLGCLLLFPVRVCPPVCSVVWRLTGALSTTSDQMLESPECWADSGVPSDLKQLKLVPNGASITTKFTMSRDNGDVCRGETSLNSSLFTSTFYYFLLWWTQNSQVGYHAL